MCLASVIGFQPKHDHCTAERTRQRKGSSFTPYAPAVLTPDEPMALTALRWNDIAGNSADYAHRADADTLHHDLPKTLFL